jgi:hypothetical protein
MSNVHLHNLYNIILCQSKLSNFRVLLVKIWINVYGVISGNFPAHLLGETNFAENVQDEWFIVHLIFQLTKQFTGLVAR